MKLVRESRSRKKYLINPVSGLMFIDHDQVLAVGLGEPDDRPRSISVRAFRVPTGSKADITI